MPFHVNTIVTKNYPWVFKIIDTWSSIVQCCQNSCDFICLEILVTNGKY